MFPIFFVISRLVLFSFSLLIHAMYIYQIQFIYVDAFLIFFFRNLFPYIFLYSFLILRLFPLIHSISYLSFNSCVTIKLDKSLFRNDVGNLYLVFSLVTALILSILPLLSFSKFFS